MAGKLIRYFRVPDHPNPKSRGFDQCPMHLDELGDCSAVPMDGYWLVKCQRDDSAGFEAVAALAGVAEDDSDEKDLTRIKPLLPGEQISKSEAVNGV